MTDKIEQLTKCIDLMQRDVAEFEAKYQGRFAEEPHVGLGNRKTRCVNEATLRKRGDASDHHMPSLVL